jgi:ferritin-like metal-binding protein YciE
MVTKGNKNQLDELFHDTLKDIYYAEKKILSSLPKMAKPAQSPQLKAAFEKHERETEGQVDRLEKVFEIIERPPAARSATP